MLQMECIVTILNYPVDSNLTRTKGALTIITRKNYLQERRDNWHIQIKAIDSAPKLLF